MDKKLNAVQNENKVIIILGDINCNYDDSNDHSDIKQLFINYGF